MLMMQVLAEVQDLLAVTPERSELASLDAVDALDDLLGGGGGRK